MMSSESAASALRVCPICQKPTDPVYKPFCSKRCADIDLSRWLKGVYVLPGEAAVEEDDPKAPESLEKDEN